MKKIAVIIVLTHLLLPVSYAAENNQKNVELTSADRLILDKIGSLSRDMSDRFGKIETKFDARFEKIETKFDAKFEKIATKFDARFGKIETKFDAKFEKIATKFDARFEKMETKFDVRFDKLHDRIDNLWITMLGGFIGVMAFIGGMVFWDRRTFLKQAKKEFREEIDGDKKKIDAMLMAMKKLAPQFPEVREALKSFGLL